MPHRLLLCLLLGLSSAARADDDGRLLGQPRADYKARRQALMAQVREAEAKRPKASMFSLTPNAQNQYVPIIALKGADDRDREDFEEGRFRQRNDFAYLTGVEVKGASLVLLPASDEAILYVPAAAEIRAGLGGEPDVPGPATAAAMGYTRVAPASRFLAELFGAIAGGGEVDPAHVRRPVLYTLGTSDRTPASSPDGKFVRYIKEGLGRAVELKDAGPLLGELRKAKTPTEVALLRKAIDITGEAQAAVARDIRPGLYEYQLESRITAAFLEGGALRVGFASIIGSGPNSTIPHYFDNKRRLGEGELVVVDIGAEYHLYTADVTRTYPTSGVYSPRQREVYQLVLDAQSMAASRFKPGETKMSDMNRWVVEFFAASPLRARDEAGVEQPMDKFFIHGLGHYLGMDVHDVGSYDPPLQAGAVFTIEPGLYIKSENIGIRIEDDYLATPTGIEKLTAGIPSAPAEVERRIAAGRSTAGRPSAAP